MRKKALIISSVIITICLTLFILWKTNNSKNERQLNDDLAVRFDETMLQTYPFLENIARALYYKVDILEQNATYAHNYYPLDYTEAFRQLNILSSNTEQGAYRDYWLRQYSLFLVSAAYGHLEGAGDLRKNECRAFIKLHYAYQNPHGALDMDYDSLLYECREVKIAIQESLRDLAKYRTNSADVNSWRYVDPIKYQHIFDRYYKEKNWPFNFNNKRH